MRQPTIVFRREKRLEASVTPPKHAPRASQGRPRPYRASAAAKEVSDLSIDRPSRPVSATCRAPSGNANRIQCKQALGRFCSRMPRRCTPRNKRRMQCHHNLSRKAASATSVARAHARRRRSPALFCLKFCLVSSHALKTRDYNGNQTAD